jgi:transglutaminase-like putative cysteine protease
MRGRRFVLAVILVLAVSSPSAVFAEDIGLYLWKIGEDSIADPSQLTDGPVGVQLEVADAQRVAAFLQDHVTLEIIQKDTQSITVLSKSSDSIRMEPGPEASAPSFIIDYDEPVITALLDELERGSSGPATPETLRIFVNEHISDKTYVRAYDIASKVAATGSGDCTEHAFLLAALARAQGYPARVVMGILMSATDDKVQSYGHAWTEIHDGQSWQRFDATLPDEPAPEAWLRYLPLMPVVNEGPGYMMGLLEVVTAWPSSVHLVPATVRADTP